MPITVTGQLDKLNSRPEEHIGEPVSASAFVIPGKTDLKLQGRKFLGQFAGQAFGGAIGGALEGLILGPGSGRSGELKLPENMYMVVGPTRFGLYGIEQGLLSSSIESETLVCPRHYVEEIHFGEKQALRRSVVEVRFTDGFVLPLRFLEPHRQSLEAVASSLRRDTEHNG